MRCESSRSRTTRWFIAAALGALAAPAAAQSMTSQEFRGPYEPSFTIGLGGVVNRFDSSLRLDGSIVATITLISRRQESRGQEQNASHPTEPVGDLPEPLIALLLAWLDRLSLNESCSRSRDVQSAFSESCRRHRPLLKTSCNSNIPEGLKFRN